jgi:hypothetical protein
MTKNVKTQAKAYHFSRTLKLREKLIKPHVKNMLWNAENAKKQWSKQNDLVNWYIFEKRNKLHS